MRNVIFLKMCVSEIRVKRIHVNQGLGVTAHVFSDCHAKQRFAVYFIKRD